MVRVEEIILSSNDPASYIVRKETGDILRWCERRGDLYLHTSLPVRSSSPEILLDLERVLNAADFRGVYKVWTGDQDARNAVVKGARDAHGFIQNRVCLSGIGVDRVTGYSALAKDHTIFHIGSDLNPSEIRQLDAMGGHFISVPRIPDPTQFEILPLEKEGTVPQYAIKKSNEKSSRLYDNEIPQQTPSEFETWMKNNRHSIFFKHLDDFDSGILNRIALAVVEASGSDVALVRKSSVKDRVTSDGVDQWAMTQAQKRAVEEEKK